MMKSVVLKAAALTGLVAAGVAKAAPAVFMTGALLGPAPNYALTSQEGGAMSGFAPASVNLQYYNLQYGCAQNCLNFGPGFFIQWGVAYPYANVGHTGMQFQGPASSGYKFSVDSPIKNVVVEVGDWAATAGSRTFTVALTNAAYAQYVDPTTTAKTVCTADITENTHAQNSTATDSAGNPGSGSGLVRFAIPASAFKCNHGKFSDLSSITVAAVYEDLAKMALDVNGYPAGGNAFGVVVGSILFE